MYYKKSFDVIPNVISKRFVASSFYHITHVHVPLNAEPEEGTTTERKAYSTILYIIPRFHTIYSLILAYTSTG